MRITKEWIPVRALQNSADVNLHICRLWAQDAPTGPLPPTAVPEFNADRG